MCVAVFAVPLVTEAGPFRRRGSSVAVGLLRISDAMQGAEPLGPYSHVARAERRCYVGNELASEHDGEGETGRRTDTRSKYVGLID